MSDNLSEEIKQQIDLEAKAEAKKLTARVPIFRHGYEAGWYDAGEKYAEKWQAAEQRAERAEKALREIAKQFKIDEMDANDCDGDISEGDDAIINVARNALTPKTGSDELHKEP